MHTPVLLSDTDTLGVQPRAHQHLRCSVWHDDIVPAFQEQDAAKAREREGQQDNGPLCHVW